MMYPAQNDAAASRYCTVQVDPHGVASLVLRNCGPLNIVGSAAIADLTARLAQLSGEESIQVLVLTCESEKAFIGGADIHEMARLDETKARIFISALAGLCDAVRRFPAPVIARIPGWCIGGGLEVAASCDLRLAARVARFSMPEVRVGIPSVIHAALLPRLIGSGRARWLVMTGESVDADTALSWGLLDGVAEPGALDALVAHTTERLLAAGPEALRAQKQLCHQWDELPLSACVQNSISVFGQSFRGSEPRERMQAFIDRKK